MTYNDTVAMNIGRDPEVFPKQITTVSTGSTTTGTGGPGTISTGLNPSPTSTGNTSKGPANVGAIVGGVVGSVVPLTLLAIAAFLYTRHLRRQKARRLQPQQMENLSKQPMIPSYGDSTSSVPLDQYDHVEFITVPQDTARATYTGAAEI